jgi:hypothetical protein
MDISEARHSAVEPRRFSCSECGRSFARHEHLKRHSAVHAPAGAFTCSTCFKRFTRNDILTRHEATHFISRNAQKRKKFRSCAACVAAKTRCSAEMPCSRCISKKIDCHPQMKGPTSLSIDGESQASPRSSSSTAALDDMNPIANGCGTPPTSTSATSHLTPMAQAEVDARVSEDRGRDVSSTEMDGCAPSINLSQMDRHTNQRNLLIDFDMPISTNHVSPLYFANDHLTRAPAPQAKELYIDSGGARLPKTRRANTMQNHLNRPRPPTNHDGPLSFPSSRLPTPDLEGESLRAHSFMQRDTWEETTAHFQRYCLAPSELFPSFSSSQFPTREDFDTMIAAYFTSFHQIVPLVHVPTLSLDRANWLFALSLATIGTHFLQGASKFQYVTCMHEFLYRALVFAVSRAIVSSQMLPLTSAG